MPGQDGCGHRAEIEEFAKIAKKDNIKFHSVNYQELIVKLKIIIIMGMKNILII